MDSTSEENGSWLESCIFKLSSFSTEYSESGHSAKPIELLLSAISGRWLQWVSWTTCLNIHITRFVQNPFQLRFIWASPVLNTVHLFKIIYKILQSTNSLITLLHYPYNCWCSRMMSTGRGTLPLRRYPYPSGMECSLRDANCMRKEGMQVNRARITVFNTTFKVPPCLRVPI